MTDDEHAHPRDSKPRSIAHGKRHFETPHGRVVYFDEGQGDAIVFVHGLVGNRTHFEHVAPAFSRSHRVIGVDMPGCGASCKPKSRHTIESYARLVLELLDSLGIARATLVGHSAGGQVCATAALIAPSRVTRLVLINSAGLRRYAFGARFMARFFVQPWLLRLLLAPMAFRILDRVFHTKNEYVRKFIADSTSPSGAHKRQAILDMCKVFHDLAPDLMQPSVANNAHRIAVPALIIWGDRDRLVPLGAVKRAAAKFPLGRLEVIEGCGHMPIIETPEVTVALMKDFLAVKGERGAA